jgi:hypothetical protein
VLVSRLGAASIVASSHEAPLYIALPIVAAVIVVKLVVARTKGRPMIAGDVVVRCSKGHVFKTTWSPFGSLTSVRLGFARLQRCPAGHHWALVKPVNEVDLTDEERRALEQRHDV